MFDACFTLCPPSFAISLMVEEIAGCFTLIIFLVPLNCDC